MKKVKLFFTSKVMRRMYLSALWHKIVWLVKQPYIYVTSVIDTIKFFRETEPGWDRYVKTKELERSAEENENRLKRATAVEEFTGSFLRFYLGNITYLSYMENKVVQIDDYGALKQKFEETREESKMAMNKLIDYGIEIPDFIKQELEFNQLDRFKTMQEYQDHFVTVTEVLRTIE